MFRLVMMVILIIGASFAYVYFQELNSGDVLLHLSPTITLDLSLAHLVLLSIATGALMVALLAGLRETRTLLTNWRSNRIRRREEKAVSLHREGTQAFLSRRTGDAITLFEKALALDPDHLDTLLSLGNVHRSQGNFPEAIRLHRKAHGQHTDNIEVLLSLAQDLEEANRSEELLQTYEDILKIDSSNLTALIRQRDLLMNLEQWKPALDMQQRLLKGKLTEQERLEEAQRLVGMTYELGHQLLEQGTVNEASRFFRKAIKHNTEFHPAYIGLAEVLIHEGKKDHAGKILHKAYRKTNNIIFLHRLEDLYLEAGEPAEIIRIYQEATQLDPKNAVLQFYLGKLYYRLEMVDEAFQLLSSLEGPHDQLEDFHKMMADLYLRKQHIDRTVEELYKALASKKPLIVPYQCTHCGMQSREWSGRCSSCYRWNTFAALPLAQTVDPSVPADPVSDRPPALPYQGIASPFETV